MKITDFYKCERKIQLELLHVSEQTPLAYAYVIAKLEFRPLHTRMTEQRDS